MRKSCISYKIRIFLEPRSAEITGDKGGEFQIVASPSGEGQGMEAGSPSALRGGGAATKTGKENTPAFEYILQGGVWDRVTV